MMHGGHTTLIQGPNMSDRLQGNVDNLVEDTLDEAKERRDEEKIEAFQQRWEEQYGKQVIQSAHFGQCVWGGFKSTRSDPSRSSTGARS